MGRIDYELLSHKVRRHHSNGRCVFCHGLTYRPTPTATCLKCIRLRAWLKHSGFDLRRMTAAKYLRSHADRRLVRRAARLADKVDLLEKELQRLCQKVAIRGFLKAWRQHRAMVSDGIQVFYEGTGGGQPRKPILAITRTPLDELIEKAESGWNSGKASWCMKLWMAQQSDRSDRSA